MPDILPDLAVDPVQHLPIIKAYADQLGLVGLSNHHVPTEMDVDAGTVVLGLVLDTLSGRSPLYRLGEVFAHPDTALFLGQALPPHAFTDDPVGRVLDRRYDRGTMRLLTACAVRAAPGLAWSAGTCTWIRRPSVSGAMTRLLRGRTAPSG